MIFNAEEIQLLMQAIEKTHGSMMPQPVQVARIQLKLSLYLEMLRDRECSKELTNGT